MSPLLPIESKAVPDSPTSPPARRRLPLSPPLFFAWALGVLSAFLVNQLPFWLAIAMSVLVLAAVLAIVYALMIVLPRHQRIQLEGNQPLPAKEAFDIEHQTRLAVIQFLGGCFFVVTVWVGFRNFEISQRTLQIGQENVQIANRNNEIAQQHLRIAEDGKITDRFSKAVEQLGGASLTERLGGLYALERIGRDSASDQAAVVDVLCAFVRDKANWKKKENRPADLDDEQRRKLAIAAPAGGAALTSERGAQSLLDIDVQAALTILGRSHFPAAHGVDLSHTDLRGAHLSRARLAGAILLKTHLEWSDLRQAQLDSVRAEGAFLSESRLDGARLTSADLPWAYLNHAILAGADLSGAVLSGADLSQAHLVDARLVGTDLSGAQLAEANLKGVDLSRARLSNADLSAIEGWTEIKSVSGAFLGSARNAPRGFIEWAASRGAVFDEATWRQSAAQ